MEIKSMGLPPSSTTDTKKWELIADAISLVEDQKRYIEILEQRISNSDKIIDLQEQQILNQEQIIATLKKVCQAFGFKV